MADSSISVPGLSALGTLETSTLFAAHDGTGLRKVTFQKILDALPDMGDNAGSHNAIYRGKNL